MTKCSMSVLNRPVRMGIIFDQQMHFGGGYQQAINTVAFVNKISRDIVETYFFTTKRENVLVLKEYGIDAIYIPLNLFGKINVFLRSRIFSVDVQFLMLWKKMFPYNAFEKSLIRYGIDLVYFISPTSMANNLEVINYMTTVWDLSHRDELEFPEVRENRIFESRERHYRSILPKAVAVFVDSPLGKLNAVKRYGVDEERIYVFSFLPAAGVQEAANTNSTESVNIREKYLLDVPYVYYPAQFWAHKNHIYLLQGLRILEDEYGVKVGAIFSGGDKGNLSYIKSVVNTLRLSDRVRFAGFVANAEVPQLYQQSIALVMPTYFGPTNLPPLEAFQLGVPVLYPDKIGLRDQIGDAALLMDLNDPLTMATHLHDLLSNNELCDEMIRRGRKRLTDLSDKYMNRVLEKILKDFQKKRVCWG